ncbi:MAG: hypothetical protein ACWGNO_00025 [Desulfobacterales bacterium]
MALKTINPNGQVVVEIPATESIAISNYGGGIASIYYLIENANRPIAYQFQQTIENTGVVLGAFANGKTVKIESGGSTVIYDIGASPDTGIGNADTLGGLLPSQFIRSDDDDSSSGTLAINGITFDTVQNDLLPTIGTPYIFMTDGAAGGLRPNEGNHLVIQARSTSARDIIFASGTTPGEVCAVRGNKTLLVYNNLKIGEDGGGDAIVEFWDDNSNTFRSLKWSDSNNDWYIEDSGAIDRKIWHTGDNASLGAGNGVTGSFTTADAKTVTVTNGIITSIV